VPDFSKELSRETSDLKPRANAQQMANVAAAESEQRASSNKRGLADYAAKIRGKVRGNIVLPPSIQGNPEAIFAVDQLPSGEILAVKLKRSSGNPGLDTAIERAILKSSPLPKPDDPALFQRELTIKYKPFEE
jgi:colicin import membrane protein